MALPAAVRRVATRAPPPAVRRRLSTRAPAAPPPARAPPPPARRRLPPGAPGAPPPARAPPPLASLGNLLLAQAPASVRFAAAALDALSAQLPGWSGEKALSLGLALGTHLQFNRLRAA